MWKKLLEIRKKVGTGVWFLNILFRYILKTNKSFPYPVNFTSRISFGDRIKIQDECGSLELIKCLGLSGGVYIQARSGLHISSSVYLAPGVKIISENHQFNDKTKHTPELPIRIASGVWLGANSVILPGVSIGENSVIGAGAVVTKSVPPNHIATGVPARSRSFK